MSETITETAVTTPNAEATETTQPARAVSRRDFLRRAGQEAAVTGVEMLPGARLAQQVFGPDDSDTANGGNTVTPRWFRALAQWRTNRPTTTTADAVPGATNETK